MDIKKLIKKFGGQSALAEQLGIRQSAIAYWVKKNAIPTKWHTPLYTIAMRNGIDISASDLAAIELRQDETPYVITHISPDDKEPETAFQTGARQFLFYASENGSTSIRVFIEDETIWVSQKGMAEIFEVSPQNINIHLKNIFDSKELVEDSVVRKFLITADNGKNYSVKYYNLDAIISVGYRVNSYKATQFRRWATSILKTYLIKGFALDDERLKQGNNLFDKDYFDELLERIREIRASERRFYQKITDIYRECSFDYDKQSPITKSFYAHVQDKFHYAIHGQTSAELIMKRADANKPFMGLTSYKNEKRGRKITRLDVTIGKNYLSENELKELERLVSMYLDWAENFARRHIPMAMKDWAERLDGFLSFNAYPVLDNFGKVKRDEAEKYALQQFEQFRVQQDKTFKSDFDQLTEEIKIRRKIPKM